MKSRLGFISIFSILLVSNAMAAKPMCSGLFTARDVKVVTADVDLNKVIAESAAVSEAPIKVARSLEKLRGELLAQVGPTVDRKTRETNVKLMESFLRAESFKNALQIKKGPKAINYDVVIVGMGPHAIFTLAGILKEKPDARVLILSKDDTAGATFREGYIFNINSSNKPSGKDGKPLPGLGNINELPNLPIQVSDLTSVRYPEAADLGDALVTNAYALLKTYKNVDLVFDSEISKSQFEALALSAESTSNFSVAFADPVKQGRKMNREVTAKYVVTATGLGTPKKIEEFIKSKEDLKRLRKIQKDGLATVLTFEEFVRLMGDTDRPWDLLKGKKIAVVAPGDSGNVTLEFLLGLAAQSAYGSSAVQEKVLKQIAWIGQPLDTCKAFLSKIRNRYSGISSGYKTSDNSVEPPLKAFPAKLSEIGVKAGLKADVVMDDGDVLTADLVILANGFDKLPINVEAQMSDLKAKTTVSENKQVLIAKTNAGKNFFITGPSVRLPTENELKGVIQNFVSLFNNAPRSSATGRYIGRALKDQSSESKNEFDNEVKASQEIYLHTVAIEGLQKFKGRDFARNSFFGRINNFNISAYLKATFESVLAEFKWSQLGNGEVKIKVKRIKEGFAVYTDGFESSDVIAALSYNRDFFAPLLSVMSEKVSTVEFTATVTDGSIQKDSARLSVVEVNDGALKKASVEGSAFLSRVPNYIRSLFADQ